VIEKLPKGVWGHVGWSRRGGVVLVLVLVVVIVINQTMRCTSFELNRITTTEGFSEFNDCLQSLFEGLLVAHRASRGSLHNFKELQNELQITPECSNTCLHHPTCPQTPLGNFPITYLLTNSTYISHKSPKMRFFAFATM
jgi:hypothetical protein